MAADQGEPDDEDDAPPQGTGLLAEYYDHGTELRRIPRLGGLAPTLTRLDAQVDFASNEAFALPFPPETFAVAWSGWFLAERPGRHTFSVGSDDGSRDLPFDPDTFAVRWRAMFDAPIAGLYRFIVGSDDGSRLTVAGQRLLEDSGLHGYTERVAEVWLQAGPAPLQLEYFENGGRAAVRLFYVPPGGERAIVPRLLLRPDPY